MKSCPKCGIIYPNKDKFCHNCGVELEMIYEKGKTNSSSFWKENDYDYNEEISDFNEYKELKKKEKIPFDSKAVTKTVASGVKKLFDGTRFVFGCLFVLMGVYDLCVKGKLNADVGIMPYYAFDVFSIVLGVVIFPGFFKAIGIKKLWLKCLIAFVLLVAVMTWGYSC